VKIKLGIKVLSILSSMVLSLIVIAGCNEESAPPGPSASGPPPGTKKPGENVKPLPPTPTDKPADKPAEKP
jgi:hypothetical protein